MPAKNKEPKTPAQLPPVPAEVPSVREEQKQPKLSGQELKDQLRQERRENRLKEKGY
jgi:hypothetical protein